MAYVKLAPLAVFLLATFCMFSMEKVGAADCNGVCSPFEMPPCGSRDCRCIPVGLVVGYCRYPSSSLRKIAQAHPNLCKSNDDCLEKETGRYCAQYPNSDVEYGWCFASKSEAEDLFDKIAKSSESTEDFLKMFVTA